MKKIIGIVALLVLLVVDGQVAKAQVLSDKATIKLVTVAPGEELYTTFGHSALEVRDSVRGIYRCFNYGTFDFEQPGFVLKFMQGRLLYFLNIERCNAFDYSNIAEERTMVEFPLMLDSLQKARLFQFLMHNAREENRYYKYDFFYDNCATRIRDAIKYTLQENIQWDTTPLPPDKTMRQLLHPYLENKPWTGFGIDLILGLPADHKASAQDYMFLPDHLHTMFLHARLTGGRAFAGEETLTPPGGFPRDPFSPMPWQMPGLVTGLVVLTALFLQWRQLRAGRIVNRIIWAVIGIAGIIIAFLWFFTDHQATKYNMNLMWAFPTHLVLAFYAYNTPWLRYYKLLAGAAAALMLLGWFFWPQDIPAAAAPLILWMVINPVITARFSRREEY